MLSAITTARFAGLAALRTSPFSATLRCFERPKILNRQDAQAAEIAQRVVPNALPERRAKKARFGKRAWVSSNLVSTPVNHLSGANEECYGKQLDNSLTRFPARQQS